MGLKITIFGLTLSSSWGNGHATPYRALIRALARRGHRVHFYEKDVEYYERRRDFTVSQHCSLVLYRDWEQIRARALTDATESDVAIVASFCPSGARICDELLELRGTLKVFYDLDTPITLQHLAGGALDYLRADQIPSFDLYLSFTGGGILQELERRWKAERARPLYGCVDPELYFRVSVEERYRCALSYMGTFAPDRQAKLDELFLEPARRMPDKKFVLAGSLYPAHWELPANVAQFEHVGPAEHPGLYSSSQATLNITRGGMARWGYCPSGRFFEAAACGTAILSDYWEGLETFFRPDQEILLVNSSDDVERYLSWPAEELATIAARARERTLSEHTGERRAEELLRWLEEAAGDRERDPTRTGQEQEVRL